MLPAALTTARYTLEPQIMLRYDAVELKKMNNVGEHMSCTIIMLKAMITVELKQGTSLSLLN
jgi:hypothetical protein